MANSTLSLLLRHMSVTAEAPRWARQTDAELLEAYGTNRQEAAFAEIMRRHGPMVLGVCRRVLHNAQDAEDAFQATFAALACKAGKRSFWRKSVDGWLYRVAWRTATKARVGIVRRETREKQAAVMFREEASEEPTWNEIKPILDEEINHLPALLRSLVIGRYLQGKTHAQLALELGLPPGSVSQRLDKAHERLRERLERRGISLSVGLLATLLGGRPLLASVPARLLVHGLATARAFANGATSAISAHLVGLVNGSVGNIFLTPIWFGAVLAGILACGGGGLWTYYSLNAKPDIISSKSDGSAKTDSLSKPTTVSDARKIRIDAYGDPLPEGALARIGTIRFHPGNSSRDNWESGRAVFLPDGKTLVSIHGANTVHFWELATGKEMQRLEGPANSQSIAASRDGKKLAVVGSKEIDVWNLETNPPLLTVQKVHDDCNHSIVAFAPDSKSLAVSMETQADIWLLDPSNGELRQTLRCGQVARRGKILAFTPDGKTLVTEDGLWEMAGMKQHKLELKKNRTLESYAFSSDGKTMATMEVASGVECAYNILNIRDMSGTEKHQLANDVRDSFVSFLPDTRTLLEVRNDGCIRYWDADTGKVKESLVTLRRRCGSMCLSPDGQRLAEVDSKAINVWELATGRQVGPARVIGSRIDSLAFAPEGNLLATLTDGLDLQLWDADTGRLRLEPTDYRSKILVPYLDFTKDCRVEAALYNPPVNKMARRDETLICWDIGTGKVSKVTDPQGMQPTEKDANGCATFETRKENYAVSANGRWQLWGSSSDLVLIDRCGKKEPQRFSPNATSITLDSLRGVDVSADGRTVLACYWTAQRENLPHASWVGVWSSVTGRQLMGVEESLPAASWHWPTMALSPDGRQIAAVVNNEPRIRLWEVISGTERNHLEAAGTVRCVAWSPDGQFLAGGDEGGNLNIWNVITGQMVRHFTGHRGEVSRLAFSRDGRKLASAGGVDATVLIWDLKGLSHIRVKPTETPAMDALWATLREQDAAKAWRSMQLLLQHPDETLILLSERLRPMVPVDPGQITELLTRLDNDDFHVRKRAEEELTKMGERIEPVLHNALTKKPSTEVQVCINRLLDKIGINSNGFRPGQLQAYRGIEVLERIGTVEAEKVLEEVARRQPTGSVPVEEALAALQRLRKSSPVQTP